jgi:UDP-N-acetylglucosamine--N-acetylmuramyl-(pentapeptide) pyrophosphoryl-undecaprenol N-acetylglucosamine transferase
MNQERKYRVIIGGGGTGGHVFPAISIANALRDSEDDVKILFVGARGKLEMEKVPEAGYEIQGLPVAGFQRRITWKNITFFFKLMKSMSISRKIIKRFNPDVVVGVGGYASGPILKAAGRKGVPTLIQEQNSYAGVTNKLLSGKAAKICVAYDKMEKYFPAEKIILTGNPTRQNLVLPDKERKESMDHFKLDPAKKVILLIGGSLGARTLNESILGGIEDIKKSDIQLLWQSGKYYFEEAEKALMASGAQNIQLVPFIKEMNRAFQVADIIISRAGAGTISELCIVGKPVILVPSPNVAEDHQTSNARSLSDQQSAVLISDKLAREELVKDALSLIEDDVRKKNLSKNIGKLAIRDSAQRIINEVKKLV